MYFEIIGLVDNVETIAVGGRIRDIMRLMAQEIIRPKFALCIENKDCNDLEKKDLPGFSR